jgi:hypothetical protein
VERDGGFEQSRLNQPGRTLIIPVLIGGDPAVLNPKFGPRQSTDLRGVNTPARQLMGIKNSAKIEAIANSINSFRALMRADGGTGCDKFSLNIDSDDPDPKFPEPSPIGR